MLQSQLKPAIQRNHCDLLSSGICQQHDNTQPVLLHSLYSPDLTPSILHFWSKKGAACVYNIRSNVEVKVAVHYWLAQQPKDTFRQFMP